jgi:endonuclease YncB( thermonuclease family)
MEPVLRDPRSVVPSRIASSCLSKLGGRIVLPLVVLTALGASFAPDADAARGPCLAGKKRPLCYHWTARVTAVHDGDTITANILGDGSSGKRVRMTGINAMEQTRYSSNPDVRRGHCHSLAATARLERLIRLGSRRVRLSAQHPSSRSGPRLRRAVAIRSNGRWVDLGQMLIEEGHVQFSPNPIEWAHNRSYSRGAQLAARAGRNLWNTKYCGHGPGQDVPLRMWVNWDSDRKPGRRSVDGEWVKVKNVGSRSLSIGGWRFRDSLPRTFRFPGGTVIRAGRTITLFMGRRPAWDGNRTTRFYWGQRDAVFQNVEGRRGLGDGGYLFDPQGDLRLWMLYPCRVSCGDPLRGKVQLWARARSPERVFLRNVSSAAVNLEGYVVDNVPYNYSFSARTVLQPRETLRLIVKGSPQRNARLVRYWGKRKYILNDRGDRVALRTQTNIRIDCYAWGRMHC